MTTNYKTVHIQIPRDGYVPPRSDGRGGMVAYAWYVWDRGHRGKPEIGFIDVTKLGAA